MTQPYGNSIDPISAIQSTVSRMSEADKLAFAKETGVDIRAIQIMDYDVALKYCQKHHINLSNNIWNQSGTYNYATNPLKGWSLERQENGNKKLLTKQDMYIKLADIKNSELRSEVENILNGGTPSKAFMDYLLQKYEKRQAEFEEAWAKYQIAKGEKTTLKATFEKIQKKYEGSESDFENGQVRHAEKDFKNAELDADIYLSIASYLAHRVV